jgi:triosephosphate isomerase (TIM)
MSGRYLIANWKMNLPPEGIDRYLDVTCTGTGSVNVVVAPPFPYLERVVSRGAVAAAQNCSDQKGGAFTGEVSVSMVSDCGARFVIVGHSERRSIYREDDATVARKLALAIEAGLTPVLCVGEDLACRDAGKAAAFIAGQIRAVAVSELERSAAVIVAYEPIWAIGTGRNASGAMCAETVAEVRSAISSFWPAAYRDGTPVLYGGSVTPDNIADLEANGAVDGYLVGGASLDSGKMLAILLGMSNEEARLDAPAPPDPAY